jgi:hypothetical protein
MDDNLKCNVTVLPFRRDMLAETREFSTMNNAILPMSLPASVENIRTCSVTEKD